MTRVRFAVFLAMVLLIPTAAGAVLPPGGTFVDDDGSVHESAIEAIRTAGITSGCDPVGDLFCPARPVTRAEMATFLVRALGVTPGSGTGTVFPDVAAEAWYAGFVETIAARGITAGFADGTFRPSASVSRAEMAAFIVSALEDQPSDSTASRFSDVATDAWYLGFVERVAELGVTAGCDTNPLRYCPDAAVTRAEMATFLTQAYALPLETVPSRPSLSGVTLSLQTVASGFTQPVFVDAPKGDPRLFVVDQPGRIWIVSGGTTLADPFLDISSLVRFAGEQGLLGLAFHPDYASNGRFYVDYTDNAGDTRVVEYRVSQDPNVADPGTARQLLFVDQPASNHNGGMLTFGPDGLLYVGLGDGGGAGDTYRQGQRSDTLLATITRIDVDSATTSLFVYGLRNPWRFSFDGTRVYIGDVGQGAREEIDILSTFDVGANLGWSIMEGSLCYGSASCSTSGLVLPVAEYSHAVGCSVTGGYVYRGSAIPELTGHYFFGDFCQGWIQSFRFVGSGVADGHDWGLTASGLTSFGSDGAGELYVTSIDGTVRKVVRG